MGVQTQYYQTDSSGNQQFITNPTNQLGGIWVDDSNSAAGMKNSSSSNPPGATNTHTLLAQEAAVDANENGDKCAWVGEPLRKVARY